jgi:hypothetical protein
MNPSAPGVYFQEVSGGARPIQAVGTTTTGFVGLAPKAGVNVNKAKEINNWGEFLRNFTDDSPGAPTPVATYLATAVYGFFENGGSRCYVANVNGKDSQGKQGTLEDGLAALAAVDEIAIVAAPGYTATGDYQALLAHATNLGDRVAILDGPSEAPEVRALTISSQVTDGDIQGLHPGDSPKGFGAFYFPWLEMRNPFDRAGKVFVPPSGHMAGIYARSDFQRGVHKAPANEPILGALRLSQQVTRAQQETLNSAGVNVIRTFATGGIRVWGARTLAVTDPEWRYINVRRLFNMIEESIAESTNWVVFEPNDQALWKAIRRDVGAFLTRVWRDGALLGTTPDEAFFVKCDAETNPQEVIDAGQVVTIIGLAPVKPAEFVIFKISQKPTGTSVEAQE